MLSSLLLHRVITLYKAGMIEYSINRLDVESRIWVAGNGWEREGKAVAG